MQKLRYKAAAGVTVVNGLPVPKGGVVILTEQQALFDLSLGRISLLKKRPSDTGTDANGRANGGN